MELEQTFENDFATSIEATYRFPLPENAAITGMRFEVGRRIIMGEVRVREDAAALYDEARASGRMAALTSEVRPNLLIQKLANIPPGERILVTLTYVHEVRFDDGRYIWSLPLTVGPRYGDSRRAEAAAGSATGSVPFDRAANDVDVTVRLHPGPAFACFYSPSHAISVSDVEHVRSVSLGHSAADRIPNRDFVLEFEPSALTPEPVLVAENQLDDDYLMLFLQPPTAPVTEMIRGRELVFLLDTSGSMSGPPLRTATETLARVLESAHPGDAFQIITFAGTTTDLTDGMLDATPENVAEALRLLDGHPGGGGTEMLDALRMALEPARDPDRLKIVVFLSDGLIGYEAELIDLVKESRSGARVMAFGIGAVPNRYLMDRIAAAGRGVADYVAFGDDPAEASARLHARLDRPLVTDIELEWAGATPEMILPGHIPDLYAGQPLVVLARAAEDGAPEGAWVRGRVGAKRYERYIPLLRRASGTPGPVLGTLWARRKITELRSLEAPGGRLNRPLIEAMGLRFQIVTPYTSFVAYERRPHGEVVEPVKSIDVPSVLPEAMSASVAAGLGGGGKGGSLRTLGVVGGSASGARHKGEEGGMGFSTSTSGLSRHALPFTGCGSGSACASGSGFGSGSGAAYGFGGVVGHRGGRRATSPDVVTGAPIIRGSMPRELIRRVIRKHRPELKHCYEKGLVKKPGLRGTVKIKLIIASTGAVAIATVEESTLANASVESCLVKTVLRMAFPMSDGGGLVEVIYPFAFEPGTS